MEEEREVGGRGVLRGIVDDLRLLKKILSWFETWVPTLTIAGWVTYVLFYAYAHSLPNPWRSIVIWTMILSLSILAPGIMFLSGRKQH